MDQFAADFFEGMVQRMLADEGNSLPAQFLAAKSRQRFKNDPSTITTPLRDALEKNNIALTQKE